MIKPITIASLLTFVLLLSPLGCGSKPTTTSFPSVHWRSQGDDAVPGIDHGIVLTSVVNDELMFIVWTDMDPGKGGWGRTNGRSGPNDGVFKYSMSIRRDEMFIHVLWRTKDDKTGTVTVAGGQFEMQEGSWFLVSTRTKPMTVKQLQRNTSKRPLTDDEFKELARTDEEIAEFFRNVGKQE